MTPLIKNKKVNFEDWQMVDFKKSWERQEEIFNSVISVKTEIRNRQLLQAANEQAQNPVTTPNHLIFCQHPHVYTLGKSGKAAHLLLDAEGLEKRRAAYYAINRGGDITYHGPGQLLCYPILDLDNFFTDINRYLRTLEEAVIATLLDYGLKAAKYPGFTGVWFDAKKERPRKVAAIGVRCGRWVTMHGLSLNVNTDLSYFKDIVPCGIEDKAVTSMAAELGREVNINEVQESLKRNIARLFEMTLVE